MLNTQPCGALVLWGRRSAFLCALWSISMRAQNPVAQVCPEPETIQFGGQTVGGYGIKSGAVVNKQHLNIAATLFQMRQGGVKGQ